MPFQLMSVPLYFLFCAQCAMYTFPPGFSDKIPGVLSHECTNAELSHDEERKVGFIWFSVQCRYQTPTELRPLQ